MFRVLSVSAPRAAVALSTTTRAFYSSGRQLLQGVLTEQLSAMKEAGTYKSERVISTPQSSEIRLQTGSPVLNFCANNYLGLADNQSVVQGAMKALETHGNGLSSVRFICGTQDIHKALEKRIAEFHGTEDAILYISCFDANAGIFEAILTDEDAVISDSLNHASIIDGIRLSKAKRYRYNNCDVADLEEKLKQADKDGARVKLIATDGVFSMDGAVAPLPEICDLADKYNALIFMDECHATGFFGDTGRGTDEFHGVRGRVDIINSTLGKAVGGAAGGYTAGPREVVDMLRQRSRPYLFSNSLPPAMVGGAMAAFDVVTQSDEPRRQLRANTKLFRQRMTDAGFTLKGDVHPIVPVMLGDARLASDMADRLLKRGIYVIGFSFPVVPRDQARIRVQLSASHTTEQVNRCVDAFIEVGRELGVIN
ncbi:2-amino-3-ketobutyrate coenzyme A ligase [Fonticula alba]|uniref:2-amino-3-ketobutyrate coenzyme A ligase, mitochondrial n=1 Tax=Fonticula alba TaxID=691883 RepID=A0A058Z7R5_FONAL|nr:2-amino-3-ketobutyrate coenzyme A ligase [Fonticula alba]KCV69547.1 2-amino-3-ketobutyrate coenzyme A ligase [Fonticula alba]|eukprot:XP_009496112.1 2-amino-3-ketobutyrate coenzyme A ligase [Fonticula alba]